MKKILIPVLSILMLLMTTVLAEAAAFTPGTYTAISDGRGG